LVSEPDFVMSDSEDSTVTYTEVSSLFEDLSDIGSLGVDGLPMILEDPYVKAALQAAPSPDYVPGFEYPPSPVYVPYVPKPVYLEFMPPEDDVLPAEEQPLPTVISPTADSPGYITESDPEEDLEEDDEDPEEDPADYPDNRDDDEEEEEEPFGGNADNEEEDEDEDEEEKEEDRLAPADFVSPPACRTTARMSIRDQTPIPFLSAAEVDRFLAISTPPPSPLTSYSSPLPHIPSPPLPVSSPLLISPPPLHVSPTHPLGYRATMIWLRAESPSTSHPLPLPSPIVLPHTRASVAMMSAAAPSTYILASQSKTPPSGTPPLLPIPLPTSSPPLLLPSTDCRADVPKCSSAPTARPTRGFRADYGFVATLDAEIRRDPKREIGSWITDVWVDPDEIAKELPATDVAELSKRMTNFITTVRQDTYEIYGRLDDTQDDRSLMSGQLNLLHRDRRAHARIARLMETKARLSCEAWVQSMDASDTVRSEVMALRTIVLAQQAEIGALWAADHTRQAQLVEALTLLKSLQTQVTALQSQQTPARDPTHPDIPEEAGSSS
ncbi:hypothetical protein Tco_1433108, partial [Tanacetum coccineum]